MTATPDTPVAELKGVGVSTAAKLKRLGIQSVSDLLHYFPRRYDDLRRVATPKELASFGVMQTGPITLQGRLASIDMRRLGGRRSIIKASITDDSARVEAVWFNAPYVMNQLEIGAVYRFSGRLQQKAGRISIQHPTFEQAQETATHTARLVPVYPETEGLTSKWLRSKISELEEVFSLVPESLPESVLTKYRLTGITDALRAIHFPNDEEEATSARRRFDFEQMLIRRLLVLYTQAKWTAIQAQRVVYDSTITKELISVLPWPLTESQRRAAHQILTDLDSDRPMLRLLQGDVGAGKTAVAAIALHQVVRMGMQAALMVPTETLAKQHASTLRQWMDQVGVPVHLLVGSMSPSDQASVRDAIKSGEPGIYVGTHALIQDATQFKDLALAIVDEQHRFGVEQRGVLTQSRTPHLLTMTATPIPRSLAKVLYGEQSVTQLTSRPRERAMTSTKVLKPSVRAQAFSYLREEVRKGRQGFIVYPVIDESATGLRSATAALQEHSSGALSEVRIGLLHGRLSADEKDAIMGKFSSGELDVLVATTVIEVGIDVPNATVMIIEEAQRFGLAQLHQLRGRIGRGAHQSMCFVISGESVESDIERLHVLAEHDSGFELAERDLELRGPGDLLGTKQSGFEISIEALTNQTLLDETNEAAEAILKEDKRLTSMPQIQRILDDQKILD